MADNTTLNAGTGGDVIATDDIGGVKYQIVKMAYGPLDTATLVSSSNALPISDNAGSVTVDAPVATPVYVRLSDGAAAITALPITDNAGSVTVDNAGTFAVQAAQAGNWSVRAQDGAGNALTSKSAGAERAISVAIVDGSGAQVTSFGGSGGTSSTDNAAFTRGTTAVTPVAARVETSAPTLTNGNNGVLSLTTGGALRVDISSGGVPGFAEDAAHTSSDTGVQVLAVRNDTPGTALTSTNGDYASLTVSSLNGLWVTNVDEAASGSLTATSQAVTYSALAGKSTVGVQITGTFVATVTFEATIDGTNWTAINAVTNQTGALVTTATATGLWQIDVAGYIGFRVRCSAFTSGTVVVTCRAGVGDSVFSLDSPLPAGTNVIGALSANQSVNVAQINGVTPLMGSGATGTGSHRVTIATDGQGQLVDNAAFTDGTTRVDVAGFILDETAGTALTENDVAAARIDSKRALVFVQEDATTRGQRSSVNANGGAGVTLVTTTTGGPSLARVAAAASTNATSTKASAGQLYGYALYNNTAAAKFFKFYNKASSPTVGTDTPVFTVIIPASSGANIEWSTGIPFATGIAYAITNLVADSDTTAVAANDVHGFFIYK
jgi:hypothetical protein